MHDEKCKSDANPEPGQGALCREVSGRGSNPARHMPSLERYQRILDNAPDLIICFDCQASVLYANPAATMLAGLPLEHLVGKCPVELGIAAEAAKSIIKAVRQVACTGLCLLDEVDVATPHEARVLQFHYAPERDDQGRVVSVLAMARDVTHMRRNEQLLRRAKEAAEAASRAKNEFLASMSHEIRTPLGGILGMIELSLSSARDERTRNCMALASRAGKHLLEIISDILDLSKIEAGKAILKRSAFNPRAEVATVMEALRYQVADKDLTLTSVVAPEVPGLLVGDAGRLRQVLMNLVGNAVKFTRRGQVRLEVAPTAMTGEETAQPHRPRLLFGISDTGLGIERNRFQTIFESFNRTDTWAHADCDCSGLGLSISKKLVELLDGRIWLESEVGQGSTFFFTACFELPREGLTATAEPVLGKAVAVPPLRILLAEDNEINQFYFSVLLEDKGHSVSIACNGSEALKKLQQDQFDLVLMDARMPVMDGLEATRIIRGNPPPGVDPRIPIVALTAYALEGDRERFLAGGMDGYVTKPVDVLELDRVLADLFAGRR